MRISKLKNGRNNLNVCTRFEFCPFQLGLPISHFQFEILTAYRTLCYEACGKLSNLCENHMLYTNLQNYGSFRFYEKVNAKITNSKILTFYFSSKNLSKSIPILLMR